VNKLIQKLVLFGLFLGWASTLLASEDLAGEWHGTIDVMGLSLETTVRFQQEADQPAATLDIPAQGAAGIPLQNISYDHPKVHFELPGAAVAVFEGNVNDDTIRGEFLQSGVSGTFKLKRVEEKSISSTTPENKPYPGEEVRFTNGDFQFSGSLTLPESQGPHPAVVMITGSGPQNRDEEIVGFKPFRIIAEHLTAEGIAVLRYDDRGVGGSTGSVHDATSEDFATDVLAAVDFLRQRSDIDAKRIGAIGHSEGGIIAPLAAQSGELAFVVLLAGTSMTGEEILYLQSERILAADNASKEVISQQKEIQQAIFSALQTDEGWDNVEAKLAEQAQSALMDMPAEQRRAIADPDVFVAAQVKAQISSSRSTWFRTFVEHDPVPALKSLTIPTLALFGELDLQVPAEANSKGMMAAFTESGHDQYRIEILPGANHLFQKAITGHPAEYERLEKAFVPELLPLLSDWIKSAIYPGQEY
jgi:dienelactone hydrolase